MADKRDFQQKVLSLHKEVAFYLEKLFHDNVQVNVGHHLGRDEVVIFLEFKDVGGNLYYLSDAISALKFISLEEQNLLIKDFITPFLVKFIPEFLRVYSDY